MVNSIEIEYLEPKTEMRVGSVKNIAVPSNNVSDIKKMFPGSKKTESNADMLSQSFGTTPNIEPIPSPVENTFEPVQISPIPSVQNTNLESSPVNLDMNVSMPDVSSQTESVNNVPEVTPIEQPVNVQPIEPVMDNSVSEIKNQEEAISNNDTLVNEIPQSTPQVFESGFKVSDAPNIFDNPTINKVDENNVLESSNVFNQPVKEEKSIDEDNITQTDISDDIISAEIAILENDIKHYEGLAENNRKKIELLKKQIKKEEKDGNLENTASNLFTNNGVLDDEMVLGKTPMPNLRAA